MTTTSISIIKKLLILFLVFAGIYYAKEFLMPLSIGAVLATLFLPFCKWMEKKRTPRGLATFICLLVLLLAISGLGILLGWQIVELTNDIALIKQKAASIVGNMQLYIFNHFGISSTEQSNLIKAEQASIIGFLQIAAGSMLSILSSCVLMVVYFFLLLYYRIHIKTFIIKLFPRTQQLEAEQVIYSVTKVSQQYLLGLSKMIVCLWIMYSVGFFIIGIKDPFFFAFLCGLLEIIPFVGNITGTTITVLVAAVHGASIAMLGGIVITYATVQLIQGWVLEPLILGPQVKINPLFTIIALVLGELLWGISGVILAIPLTAMFKIVCDHVDPLKPYGFLIGETENGKEKISFTKRIKNLFKRLQF